MWLSLALQGCVSPAPSPPPDDPESPSYPLTTARVTEATRAFTDLGPRLVATPAEDAALATAEDLLQQSGIDDVHREPFVWDAWRPGTAEIRIGSDTWDVRALSPTGDVVVTAPLALHPTADTVSLYSSDDGSRAEAFLSALAAGSSALVRITEDVDPDGTQLVEVGHTFQGTQLPAVAVGHDVGIALRTHLGEDATVEVHPDVAFDHTSSNVSGEIAGSGPGTVYVVAHYDSWDLSESAFDNALGAGALSRLATAASSAGIPEKRVVFLATTGEEQGLQGAIAWANDHEDEIDGASVVLTLDVLWSGAGAFQVLATRPDWTDLALQAAADEGLDAVDGGQPSPSSDHLPFQARGAGVIWCGRWFDPHYHTSRDSMESLDMDQAAAAVRVEWRILREVAGFPSEE
jgi:hypothetical protein